MALRSGEWRVGQEFESIVVDNLTRAQIVQYAGASGDFNPLHVDEIFATTVAEFESTIAHGMLTMGMTGRVVTDLVGDGQLVKFGGRFVGVVRPGDSLTVHVKVVAVGAGVEGSLVELLLATINQLGSEVFVGYASAFLGP